MSNTHGRPDPMLEQMARDQDLLPPCIVSTTWPIAPASGLVLAAFATQGYCRHGPHLVYVEQPAVPLTVGNAAGLHWLALHRDTSTPVAGWTRRPGSHYLEIANAAQPATPDGATVFAQVTVTGPNVTAVTPLATATLAAAWRGLLALGTMAVQNANGVVITGGSATLGAAQIAQLAVFDPLTAGSRFFLGYPKATENGLRVRPTDNDTGAGVAVVFLNTSAATVGSINTTATATTYNTSSDARLKHAVTALADALDAVQALKPVAFRWNADDSADEGFLAHELQQILPHAVSGVPDAVHEDGSVKPQQVDHSKLVVWLVGAVQELAARVQSLEEQLGL